MGLTTYTERNATVEALYLAHYGWLVSWVRRRLSMGVEAADVAQDTFVRLLRRESDTAYNLAEPRALLSAIARGLAVDHIRAENVRRAYAEAVRDIPEPLMPSPEQRLLLLETLTRIDAMLNQLKPIVRTAFLLSRLDGLSYVDISERLSVSLSTIEKYMAAALRHCWQMRLQLED